MRGWQRRHVEATGERYATRYRITDPERYRSGDRESKARRRHLEAALAVGAEVTPGDRLRVFEADDWTCQLCDLPVVVGDTNGPLHPSLDHTVPLALSGAHGPGNWQTAHRVCNSTKHTRRWTHELRVEARARVAVLLGEMIVM